MCNGGDHNRDDKCQRHKKLEGFGDMLPWEISQVEVMRIKKNLNWGIQTDNHST